MTARFATGTLQANGETAVEPRLDVAHVVDAVLYMARPAARRQRAVHDRHGDQDAVHRAGMTAWSVEVVPAIAPRVPSEVLCRAASPEHRVNRVGRYEITEQLGQGGMGTVYKAFDPLLTRVVAVKVISAPARRQPEQRERFFREARAAAQLSHRNIITIYDLGEQDGAPFLAMEYLEGPRPRAADARRREGMSLARKLEIALSICEGLAHAHGCGRHPPRHQAGQRLRHRRRPGQDPRLRPGAPDHVRADAQQRDGRHGELHGARAAARREVRPPRGHLLVRRAPLRAARRQEAVPGRLVRLDDVQDPARDARGARRARPGAAAAL